MTVTFGDALAGEIRKARTLRSLVWALVISVALLIAYCAVDSIGSRDAILAAGSGQYVLMRAEELGLYVFGVFAPVVIVAAVLVASSEYVGGQLPTSAIAVPRRGRLFAAKLVTVSAISTGLGLLLALTVTTFYQGSLGDLSAFSMGTGTDYLLALVMGICYWVMLGVLSMSTVVMIRSQTGVIAALIVISYTSVQLVGVGEVFQYLPTNAGMLMVAPDQFTELLNAPSLEVLPAALVTVAWTLAVGVAAGLVLVRRDVGTRQATID